MKHRVKLAVLSVLISIVGMVLLLLQNRQAIRTVVVNVPPQAVNAATKTPSAQSMPATVSAPVRQVETAAVLAAGTVHMAQHGETVDGLATDLHHHGTRAYREAILNANPSLKAEPDKLIAGKEYVMPSTAGVQPDSVVGPEDAVAAKPAPDPEIVHHDTKHELNYTAIAGDTVTSMAAALLGSDTPANQSLIINANPSLKRDHDRLIAGQTYAIPSPAVTP